MAFVVALIIGLVGVNVYFEMYPPKRPAPTPDLETFTEEFHRRVVGTSKGIWGDTDPFYIVAKAMKRDPKSHVACVDKMRADQKKRAEAVTDDVPGFDWVTPRPPQH